MDFTTIGLKSNCYYSDSETFAVHLKHLSFSLVPEHVSLQESSALTIVSCFPMVCDGWEFSPLRPSLKLAATELIINRRLTRKLFKAFLIILDILKTLALKLCIPLILEFLEFSAM